MSGGLGRTKLCEMLLFGAGGFRGCDSHPRQWISAVARSTFIPREPPGTNIPGNDNSDLRVDARSCDGRLRFRAHPPGEQGSGTCRAVACARSADERTVLEASIPSEPGATSPETYMDIQPPQVPFSCRLPHVLGLELVGVAFCPAPSMRGRCLP